MARAFVGSFRVPDITPGATADTFVVPLDVMYAGSDIPRAGGIDRDLINVTLSFADTPNAMQTKVIDAVAARATFLSYTLARNGILMPAFVKGS